MWSIAEEVNTRGKLSELAAELEMEHKMEEIWSDGCSSSEGYQLLWYWAQSGTRGQLVDHLRCIGLSKTAEQ